MFPCLGLLRVKPIIYSTWLDPLIGDLLGLVPCEDELLEIDPLLPDGAWVLDGQHYRSHDVSLAFDRDGGHIAPDFEGFAVHLDGREIFRAARPTRILFDMEAGELLEVGASPQRATV